MRHHVSRVPTLTIGTMLILSVTLIAPVRASSTPQQPSTSQQQSNAAANRAATVDLGTLEKTAIERAMRETAGNKVRAARQLGISRMQLYTRLRKFGFEHA